LQEYELSQGTFHSFTFSKFATTEVNCPITYSINLDAMNTIMDTDIANKNALGANRAYIKAVTGNDLIKGDFKFTITASASGGSTFTTPTWTLRVKCGALNSALGNLSPGPGASVTIILGVNDYYFEINGIENTLIATYPCPITKVEYLDSSNVHHADLVDSAGATPITGSTTTYRVYPADPTKDQTISFQLRVTAELNVQHIRSYTLISSCQPSS
jgi:hypothetical protein